MLAATGSIDYINVSVGTSADNNRIVPTMEWDQGLNVGYAEAIKAAVDLPVIAVGRIKHPEHAEQVLADGRADVIAVARALIADPEWVNKAAVAPERIRPCIGCNQGCFGFLYGNHPISCTVNPAVGLERTLGLGTAGRRSARRVVVVGGGPAGLEAAVAAAEFGHDVVLLERSDRLGGQIPSAASIPTRRELGEIVEFQIRELDRLGVDVRTGVTATPRLIDELDPDDVVAATGSRPSAAPIETDGSLRVLAPIEAMDLAEDRLPEAHVVVVDGVGHFPAYAPAERLIDAGRRVSVVSASMTPVANLDQSSQLTTLRRLATKGVVFRTSTKVVCIAGGALRAVDVFSGAEVDDRGRRSGRRGRRRRGRRPGGEAASGWAHGARHRRRVGAPDDAARHPRGSAAGTHRSAPRRCRWPSRSVVDRRLGDGAGDACRTGTELNRGSPAGTVVATPRGGAVR